MEISSVVIRSAPFTVICSSVPKRTAALFISGFSNPLMAPIREFYPEEYRLGMECLATIRQRCHADLCGVWRVGISPALIFAVCGRRT